MIAVQVPKLGNDMEECQVARWLKRPGDAVKAGEPIAEIETEKAMHEITAPQDGVLLKTFFDEGAIVPVFETLCEIGD